MSQVTCIAIGDPHFQVNNVPDAKELITKVNTLCDNINPDFIVILGDLLHTHEKVHTTPFNLATKLLTSLAQKAPVYLIIGNHDYCNNQQFLTNNHPFNSFKKISNITVCDKVLLKHIKGFKFVFCPYVPPERFEEALNTLDVKVSNPYKDLQWDNATCIFAHQEFYGCRFNPVATSTEGDIWPDEYPLVISGHIHNEQRLQKNIYYPGSSMQHAFGETANKTIAQVTFKSTGKFKIKKIDLEMKKKKIVYLTLDNIGSFKNDPNAYIKLVIKGTAEEIKVFRKSKRYKELQNLGIVISFAPENREMTREIGDGDDAAPIQKKNVLEILGDLIKSDNKYVKRAFNEFKEELKN